jgi:hypothetical protein
MIKYRFAISFIGMTFIMLFFFKFNLNLALIASLIAWIGSFLNFLAIYKNGWKMPVIKLLRKNNPHLKSNSHFYMNKNTKFKILCDRIILIIPLYSKKKSIVSIFSIGDMFIFIGIILLGATLFIQ